QHLIAQTAYQNPNQSNGPQYAGKMYSIAAKVAKDPDGYCELQSHVPEQNTFIGKWFYLVSSPLFYEMILMVLIAIYPSLSPTFPTNTTKTMMPHPSHFSSGSQSNRPLVTWLKATLKLKGVNLFFLMIHLVLNFQDSIALWSGPGKTMHILA
ncbi:hypothetical protein VP01_1385g4, partial [Puccinia sorghi]